MAWELLYLLSVLHNICATFVALEEAASKRLHSGPNSLCLDECCTPTDLSFCDVSCAEEGQGGGGQQGGGQRQCGRAAQRAGARCRGGPGAR